MKNNVKIVDYPITEDRIYYDEIILLKGFVHLNDELSAYRGIIIAKKDDRYIIHKNISSLPMNVRTEFKIMYNDDFFGELIYLSNEIIIFTNNYDFMSSSESYYHIFTNEDFISSIKLKVNLNLIDL